MYLDPNKSQLANMYDLVSDAIGIDITAADVTISTANAVTPDSGNGNRNSTVTLQSVAAGRFDNMGSLPVYYNRRNIHDFIGRAGNVIYVDDADDTVEKIALKICARFNVPRAEVTYSATGSGRIPSGNGIENIVFTFAAAGGSSNRLFINGASLTVTAINRNTLKLPLQPTLFGNAITSVTVGGTTYPTYDAAAVYSTQFDNQLVGDYGRTPEASFILWLNNFIPVAFRSYVKFTPENTEIVGVAATTFGATSQTFVVKAKTGATDSPVPESGIALKCNIRNFSGITSWTSVPSWVLAVNSIPFLRGALIKYWRLPNMSYFSLSSMSKNTTTGAITVTCNGLIANNPIAPVTGTFTITLNP